MANPFDQFDTQKSENPFDRLDPKTEQSVSTDSPKVTQSLAKFWDGLADTDMYEGVKTFLEALERNRIAREDPRNSNRMVPTPEPNWGRNIPIINLLSGDDPYTVSFPQKVAGGILNTGKEALKTVAGVGDAIINKGAELVGSDYRNKGAAFLEESIPEFVADGTMDQIINDGAAVIIGGGAAAKAGSMAARTILKQNVDQIPKLIKIAGTEAAFSAGATAGLNEDTEKLLVDPDGLLSSMAVNEEGTYSEELLSKKLNLMTDGLLLGGAAIGVTKTAGLVGSFVKDNLYKPVRGLFSASTAEKQMFEQMVRQTVGIEHMSKEEAAAATKRIADIVKENRNTVLKTLEDSVDVELDPLTALEKGLREEGDTAAAARVKAQRDAIFKQDYGGKPIAKMSEYSDATDQFSRNITSEAGGDASIEASRQNIVQSADSEVDEFTRVVNTDRQNLMQAKTDISEALKNDITFGDTLNRLGETSGVDIRAATNSSVDTLVDKVVEAEKSMNSTRREYYDAIPEGVDIDVDSLSAVLKDIKGTSAEIALPKPLRDLLKADEETVADSLSIVDFKYLHNEVVPSLSKKINSMTGPNGMTSDQLDTVESLKALRDNILQDQMDYVTSVGDGDAIAAVNRARDYNNQYQEFFSSGPLNQVRNAERNIAQGPGFINQGELRTFQDKAGGIVEGAFSNKNRHTAETFISLLERPESSGNANLVSDFILGKTAREVGEVVRNRGIEAVNVDDIAKSLKNEASVLYKNFPEEATRLDQFVENLRTQQGNLPALEETLKKSEQLAEEAKTRIYNTELKRFFDNQGRPFENGQQVFEDIFKNNKSDGELRDLIKRADNSDNPEVIKNGLQASFGKYLEFNPTFVKNEGEKLSNYAKILFKDKPEVIQGTERALELINETGIKNAPENLVGRIPRSVLNRGNTIIDRIITATVGYLSNTGARVRGGIKTAVDYTDPVERITTTIGNMYTEPDEFLRLASQYEDSLGDQLKAQEALDSVVRFLARTPITNSENNPPPLPSKDDLEATQKPLQRDLDIGESDYDFLKDTPPVGPNTGSIGESDYDFLESTPPVRQKKTP